MNLITFLPLANQGFTPNLVRWFDELIGESIEQIFSLSILAQAFLPLLSIVKFHEGLLKLPLFKFTFFIIFDDDSNQSLHGSFIDLVWCAIGQFWTEFFFRFDPLWVD